MKQRMKTNRISILLVACVLLTSCYTVNKAKKDLHKIEDRHPSLLSEYCAFKYRSTKKDSVAKGKEVSTVDTFFSTDTHFVECPPVAPGTPPKKVPCPPEKTVKELRNRVDTTYKEFPENLAYIEFLSTKTKEQDQIIDKQHKLIKTWRIVLYGFVVEHLLLLAFIMLSLWKKR